MDDSQSPSAIAVAPAAATPAFDPPSNCDPRIHLDWRFRFANHLGQESWGSPIEHTDRWIREAANLFVACRRGPDEFCPTDDWVAIKEAVNLCSDKRIIKDLTEARLLAQEPYDEVARRTRLPLLTIEAYGQLLFDVRGDRVRVWRAQPLVNPDVPAIPKPGLGTALRHVGASKGDEALEEAIDLISKIDGATLAYGMPDEESLEWSRQLGIRYSLALGMLPIQRKPQELFRRCEAAMVRCIGNGRTSDEVKRLQLEILTYAKLPANTRKQLARLR